MVARNAKVMLCGDSGVGKTRLWECYRGRAELISQAPRAVQFSGYLAQVDAARLRVTVWDVNGRAHLSAARRSLYHGARAIGLVYDVSAYASFEHLRRWRAEIQTHCPRARLVLAGNKTDLPRQVSFMQGHALATEWDAVFVETSCADGTGVHDFFQGLARAANSTFEDELCHSMELSAI